ncbi:hypothetical protein Zmor_019514 [Zophobas morio]|uniref:Uncharacterized protein n=1 Tax=Zophobas morio TaxID=2755281 RepID=A0AA38M976_9CUCU|nr:hypothetical protein Zmor_019514 [Zophobas morio]
MKTVSYDKSGNTHNDLRLTFVTQGNHCHSFFHENNSHFLSIHANFDPTTPQISDLLFPPPRRITTSGVTSVYKRARHLPSPFCGGRRRVKSAVLCKLRPLSSGCILQKSGTVETVISHLGGPLSESGSLDCARIRRVLLVKGDTHWAAAELRLFESC